MMAKCLATFTPREDGPTYRIIYMLDTLVLEKRTKDALGASVWLPASVLEVTVVLHQDPYWRKAWLKLAAPRKAFRHGYSGGSVLLIHPMFLPEAAEGAIHGYEERNSHRPDEGRQDVYRLEAHFDSNLLNFTQVLLPATGALADVVYLGALCNLVMEMETSSC